jgi:Uma2 family endonuclease
MAEPALPIFHSLDDFLTWENQEAQRYEFVGGVLTLMAGGTENHDLVGINIAASLNQCLRGTPCRVHGSNLKVRSPAGASMYPDAFVRCGLAIGDRMVVDDPVLVVEVLSPTTQQADLTRKRWAYQAIDTLQAMLFVAADEARVELFSRGPGGVWLSRFIVGRDGDVPLDALGIALPMADLYAGADLGTIAA